MFGVSSSSAKTYVCGAEIACDTKSAAALDEDADLDRAMKGSRAFNARCCAMMAEAARV